MLMRAGCRYNKFKSRTNVMFCLLPIFNMLVFYKLNHFWRYTHWCNILSHVWLLYVLGTESVLLSHTHISFALPPP